MIVLVVVVSSIPPYHSTTSNFTNILHQLHRCDYPHPLLPHYTNNVHQLHRSDHITLFASYYTMTLISTEIIYNGTIYIVLMKSRSLTKKWTINLVKTILVKLMIKRQYEEIDMRGGMIDLTNIENTKWNNS